MLPLADWPTASRRAICGVLTDIDDTLTTGGVVTPDARHALDALHAAGLPVIAITGRPIGWCEPLLRGDTASGRAPLPLRACVAENGAVAWVWEQDILVKHYAQDAATRAANHATLQNALASVLRDVPEARAAQDSAGRETDIAIDHSEFAHLPADSIQRVASLMRNVGLHATVSSIHINGWPGDYNKLSGARWMLRTLWNRDLDDELNRWVYVGDSTNDQLMFQHLPQTVGVANIARFAPQMHFLPRYVTHRERGAGFAEVAVALLAARPAP
jgi:HAD superfamily hydrolase (TIGR01484 family)